MFGKPIDSLPGEFTGRIFTLGLEEPCETGAGLVLLFEFFGLPDRMDEIRGFGGEVGPNLIQLVVIGKITERLFSAFPCSRIVATFLDFLRLNNRGLDDLHIFEHLA